MYTGPHIIKDGLVFGYDTGYGIADNSTATRFYPGEPTTNAVPLSTFINTSNWTGTGWSGAIAVSADYDNTLELTSTNGWRTFRVDTGVTSGGTVTVSYEYRMKTLATANVFMLNLNGYHLGSYVNSLGSISASDTQDSSNWKTFTGTFTANSNSNLAIGLRGSDNAGLTDTIYVRNLQVELNGHVTPYTTTSRSSTASLIDLKETTDIDVSNVTFDSTGQPTFDGAGDRISMNAQNIVGANTGTVSAWVNLSQANVNHAGIFCCQTGPAWANMRVVLNVSSPNRIRLAISNGTNSTTDSCRTNSTLSYNTWYHIAATYDGTSAKIYVNGVLDETHNTTITPGTFTPNATMVGYQNYSTRYFNGGIAAVSTYDIAMTATEVKQNFNAHKNRFDI
jgi:hypothetical protein